MNAFVKLHPHLLAIYFFSTIAITMFTSNPVIIVISLLASICFYSSLFSISQFIGKLKGFAIVIFLCTIFNPLFSQNGKTVLLELSKIKITLQSLLFGCYFGVILVCSMIWFMCVSQVFTNEKILYLFGKHTPKTALTISLSLKLIPDFFIKFHNTMQSQKALGIYNQSSLKNKLKFSSNVFLAVCGDVLESSAQTSDSMRARGFGINKYAVYSEYRFYVQDFLVSIIIALLAFGFIFGGIFGGIKFYYYPTISKISINTYSILCYSCFLLLAFLPIIINVKECIKWKYLMSKT